MAEIGHRRWAIAEGYRPSQSVSQEHALVSHETCCMLNASEREADIEIMLYFEDRGPVGPYRVKLGAQTHAAPAFQRSHESRAGAPRYELFIRDRFDRTDRRAAHAARLSAPQHRAAVQRPRITRVELAAISTFSPCR